MMVETKATTLYTTVFPAPGLRDDWVESVARTVKMRGKDVKTKGRGPGSLEPEETAGLDYRVVDGTAIRTYAAWLWRWYESAEMAAMVSAAVGEPVVSSAHVSSAININYLKGLGGRYELHTDGEPYSAVLMCNTLNERTGGRLMLGDGEAINPKPGLLVIFDGSAVPHAVEALHESGLDRTSLPMVYVPIRSVRHRLEGLDDYLYEGAVG